MSWQPEKEAGFLLAALLAEDRELSLCSAGLERTAQEATGAALLAADLATPAGKARTIASWLRLLRPELTEATLRLPARMRNLLARGARPPLKALLQTSLSTRADHQLDDGLAAAVLRIGRHVGRQESP